ncbi:MAG TPA: hypothetical protein VFY69_05660 [Solirubrobacterales bacterium]|nr:hypothetical protein [Solirubrobacterales bacterium]
MDANRLSTGEKIVGVSAVLLFIFMFFDWFSVDFSGEGLFSVSVAGNAWEVFSYIDLFLMLTILVAVAIVVIRLADALVEPPVSLNAVVAVLGGIAVLLILYRIIDPPGDTEGLTGVEINPALGIFLGLIAAAGIAYGGYRAMQEEGTSFGEIGDQFSSRGGPGGGPGAGGTTQPPSSTQTPPPPPPSSTQPPPPPPPPNN